MSEANSQGHRYICDGQHLCPMCKEVKPCAFGACSALGDVTCDSCLYILEFGTRVAGIIEKAIAVAALLDDASHRAVQFLSLEAQPWATKDEARVWMNQAADALEDLDTTIGRLNLRLKARFADYQKERGQTKPPVGPETVSGAIDEKVSSHAIVVRTKNPKDITIEEAEQLAQTIRDLKPNCEVLVTAHQMRGYGVTWLQVISITLGVGAWATKALAEDAAKEIAKRAVEWARARFLKHPSKRPIYIPIYGPDGEVIKSVEVKNATDEPQDRTEQDRASRIRH